MTAGCRTLREGGRIQNRQILAGKLHKGRRIGLEESVAECVCRPGNIYRDPMCGGGVTRSKDVGAAAKEGTAVGRICGKGVVPDLRCPLRNADLYVFVVGVALGHGAVGGLHASLILDKVGKRQTQHIHAAIRALAVVIAVPRHVHVRIHVALSARTGVGGVSLFRAGGRRDGGGVGVLCLGAANGAYAVGKAMPAVRYGAVGVGVALEQVFGERLGQERVPLGVDVYAVAARLAYVVVLGIVIINAAILVGVEDGNAVLRADLEDRRAKLTKRVALLVDLVLRPVASSSRDGIPGGDQGRDEDELRLRVGLLLTKGLDLFAPCAHGAVDRGGVLASLFAKAVGVSLRGVPIVNAHHDRDERRSAREVIQLFDVAGAGSARAKHGSACAAVDGVRAQKIGKKGDVILGSGRGSDARRDAVTDADDGLARIEIRGTGTGDLDL